MTNEPAKDAPAAPAPPAGSSGRKSFSVYARMVMAMKRFEGEVRRRFWTTLGRAAQGHGPCCPSPRLPALPSLPLSLMLTARARTSANTHHNMHPPQPPSTPHTRSASGTDQTSRST
jgi:hypothetical protein